MQMFIVHKVDGKELHKFLTSIKPKVISGYTYPNNSSKSKEHHCFYFTCDKIHS